MHPLGTLPLFKSADDGTELCGAYQKGPHLEPKNPGHEPKNPQNVPKSPPFAPNKQSLLTLPEWTPRKIQYAPTKTLLLQKKNSCLPHVCILIYTCGTLCTKKPTWLPPFILPPPPPPLRKHQPGQESDGQTGSWCLDKAVQPRGTKRMLGSKLWNGFKLPIPWHKSGIRNIFGEVKRALIYFK